MIPPHLARQGRVLEWPSGFDAESLQDHAEVGPKGRKLEAAKGRKKSK